MRVTSKTSAARALFAALLLSSALQPSAPGKTRARAPRPAAEARGVEARPGVDGLRVEAQTAPSPTPTSQNPSSQNPPSQNPRRTAPASAPKAAAPTPGAAEAAKEQRPAAPPLTGRVVGEGGEPFAGVPVYAVSRAAGGNMRSPHTSVTDEGGGFQFQGLAPGLYLLNVTFPGYVPELDPQTGRTGATYRPGDDATLRLVRGGVITGSVTDQQGEPLVALSVRALRVRDLDGRQPRSPFPYSGEDRTDDRGVYRIYGLQSGIYVVYVGGLSASAFGAAAAYGGDVMTFYPSGTRDTAAEVSVRGGQEAAGIDIRYREERGHRVTGTVEFPAAARTGESGIGVLLSFASTGMLAGSTGLNPNSGEPSFSIEGLGDGEYDLQAQSGGREGMTAASAPQRISVRGADVTGLRLTLSPLASAAGTLRVEPPEAAAREACKAVRSSQLPQETLVTLTPERAAAGRPLSRLATPHETTPDETGAFAVRSLEAGRYRLSFRLFDEALYVRSVQLPAAPSAAGNAPGAAAAARDLFELKAGQQLTGLSVGLAEGAAAFAGRLATTEGAAPQGPAPTRVHLVPQERERADDPLRFHEAAPAPDGTFSFKNLAPGRYRVLARAAADAFDAAPRPAAWDADARAALRREAEAAGHAVELQPCQRTTNYVLRPPQPK